MDSVVKKHLTVIIGVTLACLATAFLLMTLVRDSAASLSANQFSLLLFIVPCAVMFVGSFITAATAETIGRQLYLVVLALCLAAGFVSMAVGSAWLSDAGICAQLLANSPEDTVIVPILRSPITMIRDVAAFVVIPTVGCILGAWAGSRLHPMRSEKRAKKGTGK